MEVLDRVIAQYDEMTINYYYEIIFGTFNNRQQNNSYNNINLSSDRDEPMV